MKELRTRLVSKAKEHRIREAKALGLDVNQVEEDEETKIEQELIKVHDNDAEDGSEDGSENESEEIENEPENKKKHKIFNIHSVNQLNPSIFIGQTDSIARIAAERSKLFNLNNATECFGDSDECEEE